jgi:hypothetical protein
VDSDLAESIFALKSALEELRVPANFGTADPNIVGTLKDKFQLPRRYRTFLAECDPVELETVTPTERLQLFPAAELQEQQRDFSLDDSGELITAPARNGWRPSWFIIGQGQLGDPYFLDTARVDAEGDCPVYTAMSGTESWQPRLCGSSFAMFVRILAISMEVAQGFDLDDYDPDNERVFREAVGPRIREVDPAALKAGHWT